MRPSRTGPLIVACVAFLLAMPAHAQLSPTDDTYRPIRRARKGPAPPPVAFEVVARVPLPGALGSGGLSVAEDGRVVAALRDGPVAVDPRDGGRVEPVAGASEDDGWVAGGSRGKLRFRVEGDGRLRAEKRSRSTGTWRTTWTLRLPTAAAGPPLADGSRLYVGSSDNRVYALKAHNGHRLWVRDLGARAIRPMAVWSGVLPESMEPGAREIDVRLILLVRGDGASAEALDPHDGTTAGSFSPAGDDDRLEGGPVVLHDGRVAVVRRGWRQEDVELLVLSVKTRPPRPVRRVDDGPEGTGATEPPRDVPAGDG